MSNTNNTSGTFNPYAAPTAPVEDVSANAEAEAIRKAHINHEASIKAVGILYYLGGVGVTLAAIAGLMAANGAADAGRMGGLLAVRGGGALAGSRGRPLWAGGRTSGFGRPVVRLPGFPGRTR